ncbi:MAG: AAA family ATPase [Acidobacteriota bacterium]|nr:AAA family ATPase [Acidobacteriota bacterium]
MTATFRHPVASAPFAAESIASAIRENISGSAAGRASRVRDLFQHTKRRSPRILLIDELDAIGKSRAGPQAVPTNEERVQTAEAIDSEVRERIERLYNRVKAILTERHSDLDLIASALPK